MLTAVSLLFFVVPSQCIQRVGEQKPADWKRRFGASHGDLHVSACGVRRHRSALADCAVCRMSGGEAPQLFVKETSDGFGSRLHNIIYAMAFAARHGMNLGGVISYSVC